MALDGAATAGARVFDERLGFLVGLNANNYTQGGNGPDQEQLRYFFHDGMYKGYFEDDGSYEEQSFDNNYTGHEYTGAGYLMGTLEMGKLAAVLGVRYEGTEWDYASRELITGDQVVSTGPGQYDTLEGEYLGWRRTLREGDYGYVLPALSVRYSLLDNMNLRFGLTRSYSRSEYRMLRPYTKLDIEEQTISRGNPELSPTLSWNVDALGEYFFGTNLGVLSGGVFYKALTDLQYTHTTKQVIDGIEYDVTQPINSDKGHIFGAEISYDQNLSFLPGALGGLGLHLNYTSVWQFKSVSVHPAREYNQHLNPRSELTSSYIISPDFEIRKALNLGFTEDTFVLEVTRYLAEQPYNYTVSFLPKRDFPDLLDHFDGTESLHTVLKNTYGLEPSRNTMILEAVLPDEHDRDMLHCQPDTPVFQFKSVYTCDRGRRPLEYRITRTRGDMCTMNFVFEKEKSE